MGLLRILLFVVLGYYLFKLLRRLFSFTRSNPGNNPGRPAGRSNKKPGGKKEDDLGEYVDYEDIKD